MHLIDVAIATFCATEYVLAESTNSVCLSDKKRKFLQTNILRDVFNKYLVLPHIQTRSPTMTFLCLLFDVISRLSIIVRDHNNVNEQIYT